MTQGIIEDDGAAAAVADLDNDHPEDAPAVPIAPSVADGHDQALDEDPDPADDGTVAPGADDPADDDGDDDLPDSIPSNTVGPDHLADSDPWWVRLLRALGLGAK